MSISSDNLPYFQYIVKNNFPVGDFQNAVFLVLNAATDESDAIIKLNNIAGRNIFVTPTPSSSLQNSINIVAPSTSTSPDLTTIISQVEHNVTNLQTMVNNIQNTLTTKEAYFKPFTGIAQNCNNSNIPFTLMNTSIIAQSYGTELSFYQALRTCKTNAMNPNANHYLPIKAADGTINCIELAPSDFATQCELILNGDVAGYGASAPAGTITATVAGKLTGTFRGTTTISTTTTEQTVNTSQDYAMITTTMNGLVATAPANGALQVPVTMTFISDVTYTLVTTINNKFYSTATGTRSLTTTVMAQFILPAPETIPTTITAPVTITLPVTVTATDPITLAEKEEVEVIAQVVAKLKEVITQDSEDSAAETHSSNSYAIEITELLMTGTVTVSYE